MNGAHVFTRPDVTIHCLHGRAASSQIEGAEVKCSALWKLSFLVETSLGKSNFCLFLISCRLGILMMIVLLSSQNICKLTSNPF